jgi:predicted aspartyl protease
MNRYALSLASPDEHSEIPAPILQGVQLSDPQGNYHPSKWPAKLDTGASCSVIPIKVCLDLGLKPRDQRTTFGFDRSEKLLSVYYVQITVPGYKPFPVGAIAAPRQSILLGRDFLKKMVFLLNSPESWLALAYRTPVRGALSNLLSRV